MSNSYQFYAVNRMQFGVMFFIFVLVGIFLSIGIFIGIIIYAADSLSDDTVMFLIVCMIISFLVSLFMAYKISNKSARELWKIGFDNVNIKISSDKKAENIFLISQLAKIELFAEVAPLGKGLGIGITFEKVENVITPQRIRIDVNESSFSREEVKNNYSVFKQFIENLDKQILQSAFELTEKRDQYLIGSLRFPARHVYIPK